MDPTPPILRRLTPWILAVTLLFLTGMAVSRVLSLRQELAAQVMRQLEDDLKDRVETWESGLVDQLSQWTEVAGADPLQGPSLQARMRQRRAYFDSLYVWLPAEQIRTPQGIEKIQGKYQFPREALIEDPQRLAREPCLIQARGLAALEETDALQASAAYRTWCRDAPPPIRIVALSEAVTHLLDEQLFDDALEALDSDGLPVEMTLREASLRGISPFRAMVLKFERADLYKATQRDEEAYDLLLRIGIEITELDAPELIDLVKWVDYAIWFLERHKQNAQALRLRAERERAVRRLGGFNEVTRSLLDRLPPSNAEPPRFIYDQYDDDTYLLFTRWVQGSQQGVALQLDQQFLLEDFLESAKRFRGQLQILDANGSRHAGVRRPGPIAMEVPFRQTLPHLRVALMQSAVDTRLTRLDKEWVVPALLAGMMLLMGFFALYEQVRASRQQRLLLQRQREFATRVTHELKTPLAGIKVMAENLELGLYNSDEERSDMAKAIVRETDNLTARVNEILSVAKERTLRNPEPFDPEEAVLEAVELWGPRLDAAGVEFEADLHPTDEVMGDMEAVRDAVACLLDNALKYRREDADPSRVLLTLTQEGSTVEIAVSDNGIGVPPDMRKQIFERFVRVEGPNRGKAGGHGLGLAQVAQIASAHKGRAKCDEGIDGGSRFVLQLPALS
ncbi:MAG: HAMP domain-containing histidine kinase [Alphaproteobacteria bacterium]|nr:HAMP domain-containing histidine kinase [Alphaproteobacteria bacterium]